MRICKNISLTGTQTQYIFSLIIHSFFQNSVCRSVRCLSTNFTMKWCMFKTNITCWQCQQFPWWWCNDSHVEFYPHFHGLCTWRVILASRCPPAMFCHSWSTNVTQNTWPGLLPHCHIPAVAFQRTPLLNSSFYCRICCWLSAQVWVHHEIVCLHACVTQVSM